MGNGGTRVSTSSYSGVQALSYGCDMARMLKGLLDELMFGNLVVEIPTSGRSDKPEESYHVDSANSAANGKRLNGF